MRVPELALTAQESDGASHAGTDLGPALTLRASSAQALGPALPAIGVIKPTQQKAVADEALCVRFCSCPWPSLRLAGTRLSRPPYCTKVDCEWLRRDSQLAHCFAPDRVFDPKESVALS